MKYKCPSCKIFWEDERAPTDGLSHPLCIFCVKTGKVEKELIYWQLDHLFQIQQADFYLLFKNFMRYIFRQLDDLKGEIDVLSKKINDSR